MTTYKVKSKKDIYAGLYYDLEDACLDIRKSSCNIKTWSILRDTGKTVELGNLLCHILQINNTDRYTPFTAGDISSLLEQIDPNMLHTNVVSKYKF